MSDPEYIRKSKPHLYTRGQYRQAARLMFPTAHIPDTSHTHVFVDGTGAFVEMNVWVPKEMIEETNLASNTTPKTDVVAPKFVNGDES